MKILICYAGWTGTTECCAQMLAHEFTDRGAAVTVVNLVQNTSPNLDGYDIIVIGSAIRYGNPHKVISNFVTLNHEVISKMPAAYYVCSGSCDNAITFYAAIPDGLPGKIIAVDHFGAKYDMKKLHGAAKFIAKMALRFGGENMSKEIMPDKIICFADKIKEIFS